MDTRVRDAIATIIDHCERTGVDFDEQVNAVFAARILTPLPGTILYQDAPREELEA
jgi:hypothetical protein